jgi:hypothetical protein
MPVFSARDTGYRGTDIHPGLAAMQPPGSSTFNQNLKLFFTNMPELYRLAMEKSTLFRSGRNCVFLLHVHLVFVTKYRRNVFTKEILQN